MSEDICRWEKGMKKIIPGLFLLIFLLIFQGAGAYDGTCGTNVAYTIEGNTINFSKANAADDAVFNNECGEVFKEDPNITAVNITEKMFADENLSFSGFYNVREMYLSNFDVSNIYSMHEMFSDCASLETLDIGDWDTSYAAEMNYMFSGCSSLTSLDLSSWNTSKIGNMTSMFVGCSSLTSLDLNSWDTSNVRGMSNMFDGCSSLTTLDISSWNTSNVTQIPDMFNGCSSLTSLDLSGWNTSNVMEMYSMFAGCNSLTDLNVSTWNTSNVADMYNMFYNCTSLSTIDVSNWNTGNVTRMQDVFLGCSSLTSLDLSGWDTSNVINMQSMFTRCRSLTNLNVSSWNTSNVTNMNSLFSHCSSLTYMDVSAWDTSGVIDMAGMFYSCSSLTNIDVSDWDTSSVTIMADMFALCYSLPYLDVSSWDTSSVTNMADMFHKCHLLNDLNISSWNTSNVTNMSNMFTNCHSLKGLDLHSWNTASVLNMEAMFSGCETLSDLDVNGWNTSNVTNMKFLFDFCSSLTSLDLTSWDTSNLTYFGDMFLDCNIKTLTLGEKTVNQNIFYSMPSYDLPWVYINHGASAVNPLPLNTVKRNDTLFTEYDYRKMAGTWTIYGVPTCGIKVGYLFDGDTIEFFKADPDSEAIWGSDCGELFKNNQDITTVNVSETVTVNDGYRMFYGFRYVRDMYLSNFDTSNAANMAGMFQNCSVSTLDASGWDTSNVTDMNSMFYSSSVKNLDTSGWDTSSAADMGSMFYNCGSLTSLDLNNWDVSGAVNMESMFRNCYSLTNLNISQWDVSGVTDMQLMFSDCRSLPDLDLSRWNTSSVTNMMAMFSYCQSLTSLDLSRWNTSSVTNMGSMFTVCSSLTGLDLNGWNTSNVRIMDAMFWKCYSLTSLDLNNWNTSNVTVMEDMFRDCTSLTSLNVSNWDVPNVQNMKGMFWRCYSLTSLDLSGWSTSSVTAIGWMFRNCYHLASLDLTGWDTSNLTVIEEVFTGCTALNTLTLGKNTVNQNIFVSLPNYNETWYYIAQGESASNPLILGSFRKNTTLFTKYDYSTMAGTWTTEPAEMKVVVTITGHQDTAVYDGKEHSVSGYDVEINTDLYTESDFEFTGTAEAKRTNAGRTDMGLKAEDFVNRNEDFTNVTFVITDGYQEITKVDEEVIVTITGHHDTAVYDREEHSVSGYDVEISGDVYTENDFEFSGTAEAKRTDAGITDMGLKAEDFVNINDNFTKVTFRVTDGYQEITKVDEEVIVTITGHHDTAVYDREEHSVSGYDVEISGDVYTENDFEFSGTAEARRTDIGRTDMGLKEEDFVNINENFTKVTFSITDGYQEITDTGEVVVTITGHHNTAVYDGEEHSVSGYDVEINNALYTENDFDFSGTAEAKRTDAGRTDMGLKEENFENKNGNFTKVTFSITDGYQEITQMDEEVIVTITGHHDTAVYDGEEHSVSGYDVEINNALYTENDFDFSGTAEAKRTDAGITDMGLKAEDFVNINDNFTKVTFRVTDGYQEITKVDEEVIVTITGHHDTAVYDREEHSVSGYDVEISGDVYTENDFEFSGTAEARRTDIGRTDMGLKEEDFVNRNENFTSVTFEITDGYMEITEAGEVGVTITGHHDTVEYDGAEHSVTGYDVEINSDLYTENDFEYTGTAEAKRTEVGITKMGLKKEDFVNKKESFTKVIFTITDGYLEIIPHSEIEPRLIDAEITHVKQDGSKGAPEDLVDKTISLKVQIKIGNKRYTSETVSLETKDIRGKYKNNLTLTFPGDLPTLTNDHKVIIDGIPTFIYGNGLTISGPNIPFIHKYYLTRDAWINNKGIIEILIIWTDKQHSSEQDELVVYPLPEDEIGAYALREDGTKEYLIFHTYEICMKYMGDQALCKGNERCFHKEGLYGIDWRPADIK